MLALEGLFMIKVVFVSPRAPSFTIPCLTPTIGYLLPPEPVYRGSGRIPDGRPAVSLQCLRGWEGMEGFPCKALTTLCLSPEPRL